MARHWLRKDYGFKADWWYDQTTSAGNLQVQYSQLNQMAKVRDSSHLNQQIQIESIRSHIRNKGLNKTVNKVNKIVEEISKWEGIGNVQTDNFFKSFNEAINNIDKVLKASDAEVENALSNYKKQIDTFLHQISRVASYANQENAVPEKILQTLEKMYNTLKNKEKGKFYYAKGALWEAIGGWVVSMTGLSTLVTGDFIDLFGKQLIQDIVIEPLMSEGKEKTMWVRFTGDYTKGGNNKLLEILNELKSRGPQANFSFAPEERGQIRITTTNSISDIQNFFIKPAQELTSQKITLKIDDDTKKLFEDAFSIQAKSGLNQGLINQSKRDKITIEMLSTWDDYIKLLSQFSRTYGSANSIKSGWSENLAVYVNYTFSKHIHETTLGKNIMFFTHRGFQTLDQILIQEAKLYELTPWPGSIYLMGRHHGRQAQKYKMKLIST